MVSENASAANIDAVNDEADLEAGYQSLRALGRALLAIGCGSVAIMLVTGNPVVYMLLPYLLGLAAIMLGINVLRINAKPKSRWWGWAVAGIGMGALAIVVQTVGKIG